MPNYRIQIKFKTPWSTPLHADTIFGSLCWAMRYCAGEGALKGFLDRFPEAPLLVSNGFPIGKIPRPVVPPVTREEARKIIRQRVGTSKKDLADGLRCLKKLKKRSFIELERFLSMRGAYAEGRLIREWMTPEFVESVRRPKPYQGGAGENLVAHNSIDRITARPRKPGGLYFSGATFFDRKQDREDGLFDVYLSTERFDCPRLQSFFDYMAATGFGKDASTGKGHFTFQLSEAGGDLFAFVGGRTMTLSNGVLDSGLSDPLYTLTTKYGKVGGHWASDGTDPFKSPILMVQAGSTFQSADRRPFYGGLLSGVHSRREEIRHYGCLYPVMFNTEESS